MKRVRSCICFLSLLAGIGRRGESDARLTVDAGRPVRTVDDRLFGVNAPSWDGLLDTSNTIATLRGNASLYCYCIRQDEAARTGAGSQAIAKSVFSVCGARFTADFQQYSASVMVMTPR